MGIITQILQIWIDQILLLYLYCGKKTLRNWIIMIIILVIILIISNNNLIFCLKNVLQVPAYFYIKYLKPISSSLSKKNWRLTIFLYFWRRSESVFFWRASMYSQQILTYSWRKDANYCSFYLDLQTNITGLGLTLDEYLLT